MQLEQQRTEIAQLTTMNAELTIRVATLEDQIQRFFKLFDQHSKDVSNKIEIMQQEDATRSLAIAEYIVKQDDAIDALDKVISQEVKARLACDTKVSECNFLDQQVTDTENRIRRSTIFLRSKLRLKCKCKQSNTKLSL